MPYLIGLIIFIVAIVAITTLAIKLLPYIIIIGIVVFLAKKFQESKNNKQLNSRGNYDGYLDHNGYNSDYGSFTGYDNSSNGYNDFVNKKNKNDDWFY